MIIDFFVKDTMNRDKKPKKGDPPPKFVLNVTYRVREMIQGKSISIAHVEECVARMVVAFMHQTGAVDRLEDRTTTQNDDDTAAS